MGVLNRIVLIFILLAAAGSAVLSYFLFEKRTQMLQGWEQMASEINATAKELDKDSGTQVATGLTGETLHHRNPLSEQKAKLNALHVAASNLVSQRNALANTIRDLASAVEVTTAGTKELCELETSAKQQADVLDGVRNIRQRNDAIMQKFVNAGAELKVSGSVNGIKADSAAAFSREISQAVSKKNTRIAVYESNLDSIAGIAGASALNKGEDQYQNSARDIAAGVGKQRDTLRTTQSNLNTANNNIARLEREKTGLEQTVEKSKKDIADRDDVIKDLRYKLNPTSDPDIDRLIHGKKDKEFYRKLYSLVQGHIKKVDRQWSFLVLDVGGKFEVKQTIAGKTFSSLVNIPADKTMTVVRGLGTDKPVYIGKILITEIHNDYAIANFDPASQKEKLEEGDTVIFLNDDIDKLLADSSLEAADAR